MQRAISFLRDSNLKWKTRPRGKSTLTYGPSSTTRSASTDAAITRRPRPFKPFNANSSNFPHAFHSGTNASSPHQINITQETDNHSWKDRGQGLCPHKNSPLAVLISTAKLGNVKISKSNPAGVRGTSTRVALPIFAQED